VIVIFTTGRCAYLIASVVAMARFVDEFLFTERAFESFETSTRAVEAHAIAVTVFVAGCEIASKSIEPLEARTQCLSKWSGIGKCEASALVPPSTLAPKLVTWASRDLTSFSSPIGIAVAQTGLAITVTVTTVRVCDVGGGGVVDAIHTFHGH